MSAGGLAYRPDIDGLRAVAIALVVAFHGFPAVLPGGFVGVDVFFVVSGYLIAGIILAQLGAGRFSFAEFYARRACRLFPALAVVLAAVLGLGWLVLLPDEFAALGRHVRAGALYLSNFVLAREAGYFDAAAETKPLLHLWSLAIEEQFYLIWPALICLVGRRGVVPLALAVVVAAVWARSTGMYWRILLTRADGLALGAILAALFASREALRSHRGVPRVLTALGLAALAYLTILIGSGGMTRPEAPPRPALTMLVINVLGASIIGLVIYHRGKPALAFLRRPRLVWVGQLSYGIYVYHYVLMLLSDDLAAALGRGGRPFWREALTVALIFGLAALSWRFVELPLLRLKDRFEYGRRLNSGLARPHIESRDRAVSPAG